MNTSQDLAYHIVETQTNPGSRPFLDEDVLEPLYSMDQMNGWSVADVLDRGVDQRMSRVLLAAMTKLHFGLHEAGFMLRHDDITWDFLMNTTIDTKSSTFTIPRRLLTGIPQERTKYDVLGKFFEILRMFSVC
jgi:hypothetical protein